MASQLFWVGSTRKQTKNQTQNIIQTSPEYKAKIQ